MGFGDETGHYPTHFIGDDCQTYPCENVDKIDVDQLEMIKIGDILKFEEDGQIAYIGFETETTTVNYDDIKDSIRKGEDIKLLKIIPGNYIEGIGYEVKE